MKHKERVSIMNTDNQTTHSNDPLEQLFAQVRSHEPELDGGNFTKVVINRLPTKPKWSAKSTKKQYYVDGLGFLLGLLACALVIQPHAFIAKVIASFLAVTSIPSITISPLTILMAVSVTTLLAFIAWWTVERDIVI